MRDSLGGSVGAVRGAEGVIDENCGVARQLPGEVGIVFFLLRIKAGVLEQQHFALLQRGAPGGGGITDAIRCHDHRLS